MLHGMCEWVGGNGGIKCLFHPAKNRQCLNRWLVAYTLLRNPSIQNSTAANIAAAAAATATVNVSTSEEESSPTLEVRSPEPLLHFSNFD